MADLVALASPTLWAAALLLAALWVWKELTMGIHLGQERLDGKLVVITGANCGIGLETAKELARRGATLILGCRSRERGETAVREIVASSSNTRVEMVELDLLDLSSVRRFAKEVAGRPQPIHLLINNAGFWDGAGRKTWAAGKSHLSADGLEFVTQCNHLAPFLLTNLLRARLAAAGTARVINVSSIAAVLNWQGIGRAPLDMDNINYAKDHSPQALKFAYHNSKLMNILFSREMSRRWGSLGITSYSAHPGLVRTEVFRNFSAMFESGMVFLGWAVGKSCLQGAHTTLHLALQPGLEGQSGSFFGDCRNWDFLLGREQVTTTAGSQLWEASARLVGIEA